MRPDTITIKLRGREVDVEYIDGGYEPDVNYYNLEWWFAKGQDLNFNEGDIDDDETYYIHKKILGRDE